MTLAERIARLYAGKYSTASPIGLPARVDIIMKATHGATQNRLANGGTATANIIAQISGYLATETCFSTYSENPGPADEVVLTLEVLPDAIHVGAIPTTSAEAIALGDYCTWTGRSPRRLLIITDEFNSRRTKDIYQMFFPETKIFIAAIPAYKTFDPESPILNFRSMNRAIMWETLIPMIPFWIMTHTGSIGKRLLVWLSNRVCQTPATKAI